MQQDGPEPVVEPSMHVQAELERKIRNELVFQADVELVDAGTLAPKGIMKTRLVAR